jgi:hypothetical protein
MMNKSWVFGVVMMAMPICMYSTPSEDDGKCVVEFDFNYDGTTIESTSVKKGCAIQMGDCPQPQREGYRFAGWFTSKECKPEQQWLLGAKKTGYYPPVFVDSMAVNHSMRLYARWVSPVSIKTAEQLDKVREDLCGWYLLDADIDLSGIIDWNPIGSYESDYEMADGEWWKKAFKGILDGQGHKIIGLNLTTGTPTMKALFGAVANGEVCNLVIENCNIDIASSAIYTSPLIAVMKQDEGRQTIVQNVEVKDARIKVHEDVSESNFSSVTGLIAGVWNGMISDCHVSGHLDVTLDGSGKNGDVYVGGIIGEGYSDTKNCSSALDIDVCVNADAALKIAIGGLQAAATNVDNSISTGNIMVTANQNIAELYVGGLIGSERYGHIRNCASQGNIIINDAPKAMVGGILGEFNSTYGNIGLMFGIKHTTLTNSYTCGTITTSHIGSLSYGNVSGVGQPEVTSGWFGPGMSYTVGNCSYLNQGKAEAKDAVLDTLKGYDTLLQMKGDNMKSVLGIGEGKDQWIYDADVLPQPSK